MASHIRFDCFSIVFLKSIILLFIVVAISFCNTVESRSVSVAKGVKQEVVDVPEEDVHFDAGSTNNDDVADDPDDRHGGHGHHHDCSSEDLIKDLPGAPSHDFKQYSGYVTVDEDHGRKLFYWFVEAETSAEEQPLVLWLNGGPGCSSVAGGALSEQGPFYPDMNGRGLIRNEYPWNKYANIIFLESPAGVGFSYSEYTSDYHTGDVKTAKDSRAFLLGWFRKFPKYKNRTFYISGESYAGHYVPDLALLLLKMRSEDRGIINFKGFLLGNPWTVTESDYKGVVDTWYARNLISTHTYKAYLANCNSEMFYKDVGVCRGLTEKAYREMGNINPYDIYVDACPTGYTSQASKLLMHTGLNVTEYKNSSSTLRSTPYDACIDDHVEIYLNQKDVQEALHAAKLPYRWVGCSDIVDYSTKDALTSKFDTWIQLLSSDLSLTVYSGDVDSVCPTAGTRDWILRLEEQGFLSLSRKWYPWYHDGQVGGRTEEYNKGHFKFVTVRDAGHMVPYTQPARGLVLFKTFLASRSMPTQTGIETDSEVNNGEEGGSEEVVI